MVESGNGSHALIAVVSPANAGNYRQPSKPVSAESIISELGNFIAGLNNDPHPPGLSDWPGTALVGSY